MDMAGKYHHGDLRRALVDAGLELLESGGVGAVRLRAAARLVGVSHAAPARHFPDGAAFLAAMAAEGYRQLGVMLGDATSSTTEPLEAFRAAGLAYVEFAAAHAPLFALLSHPLIADKAVYPELRDASNAAFAVLSSSVGEAQEAGYLSAIAVEDLALAAWATVHGIATLIVDDQLAAKGYHQSPADLAVVVTTVLFAGLRPDAM